MHTLVNIQKYKEGPEGTTLVIDLPKVQIGELLVRKKIRSGELRIDDGRYISIEQRKKAYATIRDISDYTGYLPEVQKEWLNYLHIA